MVGVGWPIASLTESEMPIVLLAQFNYLIRSATEQHCDEFSTPLLYSFFFAFGNGKSHELKNPNGKKKKLYPHHGFGVLVCFVYGKWAPVHNHTLRNTANSVAHKRTHTMQKTIIDAGLFVWIGLFRCGPLLNIPSPLNFN